jgi:uncharacterized protein (DUF2062 family)
VKAQLRQGADPKGLALSCAFGVMCGCFPLLGFTTILGLIFGKIFRLNHPTLQAVNYLMAPIHFAAIPFYAYLGSKLSNDPIPSLNPATIISDFFKSPVDFLNIYGMVGVRAIVVWMATFPFIFYFVYRFSLVAFVRLQKMRDVRKNKAL